MMKASYLLAGRLALASHLSKRTPVAQQAARAIFLATRTNYTMVSQERRCFAYPAHQKLEMPNLSPTMEKVSSVYLL